MQEHLQIRWPAVQPRPHGFGVHHALTMNGLLGGVMLVYAEECWHRVLILKGTK